VDGGFDKLNTFWVPATCIKTIEFWMYNYYSKLKKNNIHLVKFYYTINSKFNLVVIINDSKLVEKKMYCF